MSAEQKTYRVLLVTAPLRGEDGLLAMLPQPLFSVSAILHEAGKARRRQAEAPADIVLVNLPLPDEFGTGLAMDLLRDRFTGVLLLCPAAQYEQVADQMEPQGALVLKKPCSRQAVYQAARLLTATAARLSRYEKRAATLEARMEEIRIVNRAKWALIKQLGMDEETAHRYIEKHAMDERRSRGDIARQILVTYEN